MLLFKISIHVYENDQWFLTRDNQLNLHNYIEPFLEKKTFIFYPSSMYRYVMS